MKAKTLLVAIAIGLYGCAPVQFAPTENLDFMEISSAQQISGVYENKGTFNAYLSELLWGSVQEGQWNGIHVGEKNKKEFVVHSQISYIEVKAEKETLLLNAISANCVLFSKSYTLGKDYELSNGRFTFRKNLHLFSEGTGDVIRGPGVRTAEIGLDTKGNGKYREKQYKAGFAFAVIPIAFTQINDFSFLRETTNVHHEACLKR